MPFGSEFRVNTFTNGPQQTFPQTPEAVATNPNTGDFVVTWSSQNQDGNGWGVYAQRYNAAGIPKGSEFRVNTTTFGDQEYSTVAMDGNGNFVITWSSNQNGNWDVYAQRYNAAGVPQGSEFLVNSTLTGNHEYSTVAMNPTTGDFGITWSSNQNGNWDVYAQRYNSAGVAQGSEFQVNTYTPSDQEYSTVALDASGNFVITWSSNGQDGSGWGVYAQRYNASGVTQGGEFRVNTTTVNDQEYSTVAMDPNGNFVITWSSNGQDGSGWGVYAQRYDALGVAQGGEFRVNTTTVNDQMDSTVALDANGNFLITWSSNKQDGSGWGVYGQQYNALGNPQGGEFRINTYTIDDQQYSSVAMDASGKAVVVWSSNNQDGSSWGVYAQRYAVPGITVTPASGLMTNEAGGTATFSVVLNTQPAADVTIALASSDVTQGTVSPLALTFTPTDWNDAQIVTVTGVDTGLPDGNTPYQIILSPAVSTDLNYNGLQAPNVSVTNEETATPGITVSPTSGLTTTEAGGTATFTVVLDSPPASTVSIPLGSSNPSAGTVSTSSLVFNSSNWNVPQTVTVTGGASETTYTIVFGSAVSSDPAYSGMQAANVSVTNLDMNLTAAGATVAATEGSLFNGPVASFTDGDPNSTAGEFTATINWGDGQTSTGAVTANGGGNFTISGNHAYAEEGAYPVTVSIQDAGGATAVANSSATVTDAAFSPAGTGSTPTSGSTASSAPATPAAAAPPNTDLNSIAALVEAQNSQPSLPTTISPGYSSTNLGNAFQPVLTVASLPPSQSGFNPLQFPVPGHTGEDSVPDAALPVQGKSQVAKPTPKATPPGAEANVAGALSGQALPGSAKPGGTSTGPQASSPAPVGPAAASRANARSFQTEQLYQELDKLGQEVEPTAWPRVLDAVFAAGVASAGYVLLSSRAVFWLLSALAARPLWKQFDPIDVLFAWEKEKERRTRQGRLGEEDKAETLQSLVG